MDTAIQIAVLISLIVLIILMYLQFKQIKKYGKFGNLNREFLESIEKYVEIFNEQNVNELLRKDKQLENALADEKVNSIKKEYRKKLESKNHTLTEEHEILIDFVTLSLSLLIKTPPLLREKIIDETTENFEIRKILKSQLSSIEKHYLPVSLLEMAISKEE